MRLASIKSKHPQSTSEAKDGRLVVVSSDASRLGLVPTGQYPTLLSALDDWQRAEPLLRQIAGDLENNKHKDSIAASEALFMAPLPRCYAWIDGSAFIEHIVRVRKARGADLPPELYTIPLMYQGASDNLLGPTDDITLEDEAHGLDFEGEVAVVLDHTPQGTKAAEAMRYIKLFVLMNDISLRGLIPRELATGFGFFHGKPSSSFAPFAVTPDELGAAWKDGRVHLDMRCTLNGTLAGAVNGGEMHFSFADLIEHAAKTRHLSAGTILGSGTFSNKDESRGVSCLVERRVLEQIHSGKMQTPFMKAGDLIEIEITDGARNIFGSIKQRVVMAKR